VFRVECDHCGRFEIEHQLLDEFRLAYEEDDTRVVEQFGRLADFVRGAGGMPFLSSIGWRELVKTGR
jgi:hypothetical protein